MLESDGHTRVASPGAFRFFKKTGLGHKVWTTDLRISIADIKHDSLASRVSQSLCERVLQWTFSMDCLSAAQPLELRPYF